MANKDIIEMLSVSEEINMINLSAQNIIRNLDANPLDSRRLNSLLENLNTKVADFTNKVSTYKPGTSEEEIYLIKPSYVTENKKRRMVDIKEAKVIPPTPKSVGNTIEPIEPKEVIEEDPTMELPEIEEEVMVKKQPKQPKQPKKTYKNIGNLNKRKPLKGGR